MFSCSSKNTSITKTRTMAEKMNMTLDKAQIQRARLLFNMIDTDNDEKISVSDLKTCFIDLGIDIEESKIVDMIKGDNGLDFNGFLKIFSSQFSGFSEESELKDAFEAFKNNDGIVDTDLLKENMKSISTEEQKVNVEAVLKEFTKKNNITGQKKFDSDRFIDQIKQ